MTSTTWSRIWKALSRGRFHHGCPTTSFIHRRAELPRRRPHQLAQHRRPQEGRDAVCDVVAVFPRPRRHRGAADSHPALLSQQPFPLGGVIQRAVHDAWHHDDFPGGDAAAARLLRKLSDSPDDRGARCRVPSPQCVELLDFSLQRSFSPPRILLAQWRLPQCRMVRLREPHRAHVHARRAHRFLGYRVDHLRSRDRHDRGQLPRHHRVYARAGHDLHADAAVRVDHAGDGGSDPARVPGAHCRTDFPVPRSLFRRAFLPGDGGCDADSVAAPVLALRASRGLHHGVAGVRNNFRRCCPPSRASRCSAIR